MAGEATTRRPGKERGSIRARVRAEMLVEIKAIARRHLETDGANLSLRAVARDMGMVSSAIYRYFASRDDLLTALIIDAYNELGAAAEAADAAIIDRADLRGRFLATSRAVRRWALSKPAEYALIYGSPVPGYVAPEDTNPAAVRTPVVLIQIMADGVASGALTESTDGPGRFIPAFAADLARVRDGLGVEIPDGILMRAMIGWIHLFGAVSFELFGQLNNVIEARDEFYDQQMTQMADLIGL